MRPGGFTDISTLLNVYHARDYNGVATAVQQAAVDPSGSATVLLTDARALAADLTIPANVALKVIPGGLLTGPGALTVLGTFDAGSYPVFGGGLVPAFGPGACDAVRPEWFGTGAAAFQAAITAAESTGQGQARVVCQAGKNYSVASGLTAKRSTIIDLNGATVTFTATSGVLFTLASVSDGEWAPGCVQDGYLQGSGGTSYPLQIGNGTQDAHNVAGRNLTIKGFGYGPIFSDSTPSGAFLDTLDRVTVQSCLNDGLTLANAGAENIELLSCRIFNNGNASGASGITCTTATAPEVHIRGGSIDNNGNGTVGQIYVPTTAAIELYLSDVHMEWTGGSAFAPCTPHLDVRSAGANPSYARLSRCHLSQGTGGSVKTNPLIFQASGELVFRDGTLDGADLTVDLVKLGDGNNYNIVGRVKDSKLYNSAGTGAATQYAQLASTAATYHAEGNQTNDRPGVVNATYYATSGSPAHTWIDTSAGGVVLHLVGNGGTTPGKYLVVNGGNLEVRGDSFGTVLLRVAETVLQTAMPIQPQMGGGSIYGGAGVPTISAGKGSIFLRSDGAVGSTLYVCQGGTTWNAVAGV